MSKFFKDLKAGLEEVIAHREGKIRLNTRTVEIPEPPKIYKAKDIKKIRESRIFADEM